MYIYIYIYAYTTTLPKKNSLSCSCEESPSSSAFTSPQRYITPALRPAERRQAYTDSFLDDTFAEIAQAKMTAAGKVVGA